MAQLHPVWLEHQRRRWTRTDARLWVRPDRDRFLRLARFERKYSPDQPRVPAGNPDGGQWTNSDGGAGTGTAASARPKPGNGSDSGRNDPRVLSDVTPDNNWKPGAQYAQASRGRGGSVPVRVGSQWLEAEPGQAARLVAAEASARDAIDKVRELDPSWKPTPSLSESVEGAIATAEAEAREAQARLDELSRVGIGPGPFAGGSIPARGPGRDLRAGERSDINDFGSETGCNTCGTLDPGTASGNYIGDHQYPTALNPPGRPQRIYPHCAACSALQGGWVRSLRRRR